MDDRPRRQQEHCRFALPVQLPMKPNPLANRIALTVGLPGSHPFLALILYLHQSGEGRALRARPCCLLTSLVNDVERRFRDPAESSETGGGGNVSDAPLA